MAIITVNDFRARALEYILNRVWRVKLFANNVTPAVGDDSGDYIEVAGGGYSEITLDFGTWIITPENPAVAQYSDFLDFQFTGPTGGAGEIYGYYTVDESDFLGWVRRFPVDEVPFIPINGSLIRVKPVLVLRNLV